MISALLVLAAASVPAVYINPDIPFFLQPGSARIGTAQQRQAYIAAFCGNSDFHFALVVPNARWNSEFDYDDFAGADAPALSVALSHIRWAGSSIGSELTATATGSYALPIFGSIDYQIPLRSPQPTTFRFDSAATLDTWRQLLSAINAGAGTMTWTQTAFDDLNRHLAATFEFDAAAASRLMTAAMPCMQSSD